MIKKSTWALALAVIGSIGMARAEDVVISLSGSGKLPNYEASDEDLLVHRPGAVAQPYITAQGISFLMGDVNGNGLFDDRDDVDALDIDAKVDPPRMLLSFLGDVGGFKDGDILKVEPAGGVSIAFSEADLVSVTGAKDGNIDIDAIAIDPVSGTLYFSFAEDEESNFLSGTMPGFVLAEEVLKLTKAASQASVLYNQIDMQNFVAHALSTTPFDIQDVLGLALNQSGALYFTIQTPSDQDGTIFSVENGGIVVPGQSEVDFGFSNAAELDAIACVNPAPSFAALQALPDAPDVGQAVEFSSYRGTPGGSYQVLISASAGNPMQNRMDGFIGLFVSPSDPLFLAGVQNHQLLSGTFDSNGDAKLALPVITFPLAVDVVAQLLEVPSLRVSHPVWVELNQ
jgi:hypothetical protein